MKIKRNLLIISTALLGLTACDKESNRIQFESVDQSIEIPYEDLDSDSIVDMMTVGEVMVFQSKVLDLNSDGIRDLSFEIIDLTLFNGEMPEELTHQAARVRLLHEDIQIVDASGWGYADALSDEEIQKKSPWSDRDNLVLGTFANAGNFAGNGNKYLGFRIKKGDEFNYGWILLNCGALSDNLFIDSYAIQLKGNKKIKAGELD